MSKKIAVVTGGASGIGFAVAKALSEVDMMVVIADLDKAQGLSAAEQLNCDFVQADLSRQADNLRLIESTVELHGSVDVLVNNAGYQHICPLDNFPEDTWQNMLAVMLTSPFLLTKYAKC